MNAWTFLVTFVAGFCSASLILGARRITRERRLWDHGRTVGQICGWDARDRIARTSEAALWERIGELAARRHNPTDRGATLVTHALGVAMVLGLVLWASYTFGGVP